MKKGDKMPRRKHIMLNSPADAMKSATALIMRSIWFKFDPYPEDKWRLTVKQELDIDEKGVPL